MDVVQAVSGYITKMVSVGDGAQGTSAKMKILLMDPETVGYRATLEKRGDTEDLLCRFLSYPQLRRSPLC